MHASLLLSEHIIASLSCSRFFFHSTIDTPGGGARFSASSAASCSGDDGGESRACAVSAGVAAAVVAVLRVLSQSLLPAPWAGDSIDSACGTRLPSADAWVLPPFSSSGWPPLEVGDGGAPSAAE